MYKTHIFKYIFICFRKEEKPKVVHFINFLIYIVIKRTLLLFAQFSKICCYIHVERNHVENCRIYVCLCTFRISSTYSIIVSLGILNSNMFMFNLLILFNNSKLTYKCLLCFFLKLV